MKERKLTDNVISEFNVKYDPATRSIVFPVYDRNGKLKFLTRRSVEGKSFYIDKSVSKKDIYCLDKVIKNNIKEVVVVESQINCLTLWGWGIPAIALFGAGTTEEQIKELNNTNIRSFILAYDPDNAGIKGANKFKNLINKDRFVTILNLPVGKDVNDLSEKEFREIMNEECSKM